MSDKKQLLKSLTTNFIIIAAVLAVGFFAGVKVSSERSIVDTLSPTANTIDLHTFWRAWDVLDQKYPFLDQKPDSDKKVYGAIKGLAASYNDPYTVYFTPDEAKLFNEDVDGSFSGVGMEVGARGGFLVVIAPLKDSPADIAGIRAGDIIVSIDDAETGEMFLDEAIQKIRGKKGTEVTLSIVREEELEPIDIVITRDTVIVPTVETEIISKDIFKINLYSFSATATQDFTQAMRSFEEGGYTKLILDMRNNPGGYLDAAVDIGSFFVPQGKIIVIEDYGEIQDQTIYRSKGLPFKKPSNFDMVVLVDQGSASASEIVAGALQENDVATLVGVTTFGKGSVQELIPLPDKSSLKITVAHWLTPKGLSINEKGIVPNDVVPMTALDYENKTDPQLDKAVELLEK